VNAGIKFEVLTVVRLVVWTCALEVLWLVLVGTTQSTELIAGGIASVLTALFVEVLRRHGLLAFRVSLRMVARAWSVPHHVVFDFGLLGWVLVRSLARRRRVRGEFVKIDYPLGSGPKGRFERALVATLENESANGIVVDLDDGTALLHSLDTRVSTGRSVL
jgi:hypothetical protein